MAVYRCRTCKQPITQEMAVESKAGGFTAGLCQRDARSFSPGAQHMDDLENNSGLPSEEAQHTEASEEAISEAASEEVEEHNEPGATPPPAMAESEQEAPIQEPPENNG